MRLARLINPLAATVAVLASPTLGAQGIRGTVTLGDGNTRAASVIVVATPDSGEAVRALTNTRGEYLVRLARPGRYQLQVLRVGYRPTGGPSVAVNGTDIAAASPIRLTDIAVSLTTVTVRGDDACRTNPDTGALVARAWEEARKAIMTAQLAADGAPLNAEWVEFDRTLDPMGRIVRGLRVRTTISPTTHAFRSLPAEVLARRGYIVADAGQTVYHAPDGAVLLSESFAATHCFHIAAAPRGADTLVGVGFRPSNPRSELRDIAGTFWLDRRTAELRWMEFGYTNLPPAAEAANPGGRVDFLRLGSGGWLVSDWTIRMPEFGRLPDNTGTGMRRVVRPAPGSTVRAMHIMGGTVNEVRRNDTTLYRARGAVLDLQLVSRDRWTPAARASVELMGTDYSTMTDATGRARIEPVLPGRYEARVRTPLMDTLGIAPITREIEIVAGDARGRGGSGARRDSLRLPSADELLKSACRDSLHTGDGMVRGVVRDTIGNPVANASVVLTWQGRVKIVSEATADRMAWTEQSVGAFTDGAGRWRTCGVPREVLLIARVKTDNGADAKRVTLEPDQPFGTIDLVPHNVTETVDRILPRKGRALVEVIITDEDGAYLPGVTLEIETPDGVKKNYTTGTNSRALVPDAPTGRVVVRARKIGFRPGQVSATIAEGRNTVPIILSGNDPPALDTVRIIGDERKFGQLDEFETRRLNAMATRSFTRTDIEKRNPVSAWHLLTNVPSVKIAEQGGQVIARSMRVENARLLSDLPCYMKVMVDGVLWPESMPNLNQLPPPDQIHGIEVFAGPASIPPQYGGTGTGKWCGLIAVWTR